MKCGDRLLISGIGTDEEMSILSPHFRTLFDERIAKLGESAVLFERPGH